MVASTPDECHREDAFDAAPPVRKQRDGNREEAHRQGDDRDQSAELGVAESPLALDERQHRDDDLAVDEVEHHQQACQREDRPRPHALSRDSRRCCHRCQIQPRPCVNPPGSSRSFAAQIACVLFDLFRVVRRSRVSTRSSRYTARAEVTSRARNIAVACAGASRLCIRDSDLASWDVQKCRKPPTGSRSDLTGYADVARSVGLDPQRYAQEPWACTSSGWTIPDVLIPAMRVLALLEQSAAAAGVADFGLRLATKRQLAHVGPVSLLLRDEPTVRHAIKAFERHFLLYSETFAFRLVERDDTATCARRLTLAAAWRHAPGRRADGRHHLSHHEGARRRCMGTGVREFRPCGAGRTHAPLWFLRTRTLFDNGFDGVILRDSDVEAPILTADAAMGRYVRQYLEGMIARAGRDYRRKRSPARAGIAAVRPMHQRAGRATSRGWTGGPSIADWKRVD